MAEGLLGGLLGGEDESSEPEGVEGRVSAAAFAAAVAADHAKYDPAVAAATAEFLRDQSRLLKAQTEELNEQRALRLRHMGNQLREDRLRHFGQLLRNGLQAFMAILLTALSLGLLAMLISAFNARSVVVEPFDAPPSLAARGLSGKVVAAGVLDALTRLQTATRTTAAKRHLANAWTGDIKVEVPETGVSIGDINRMLKESLGQDIHIQGDLVQTDTGGLALTIRGDGVAPRTFEGGAGELSKLTTQAAEYAYGQSQPALYTTYLSNAGRDAEAVSFATAAYATAGESDLPYLMNSWGVALQNTGATAQATKPMFARAIALKPDFWVGYANLMNVDLMMGDEEGAWRIGQTMGKKAGGRPGRAAESDYENLDLETWNLQAQRSALVADIKAHAGAGANVTDEMPLIADIDVRLHDPSAAELEIQSAEVRNLDRTVAAIAHFVRGRLAGEAGDAAKSAVEMEAFQLGLADPIVSSNYPGYACWIAPAEEDAGHPDKADAALKAGGRYVDCYRFRGDILDHRGDWIGAHSAYAAAVAIAPDLPAGYYSWGLALARHGDLAGAQAKLAAAHLRGPTWADPLKAWGDVLARQNRWGEALARYDEALKHAPAWAVLRASRDAAAKHAS
jgi:tetratricopeptide (TPR) repeat protein